MDHERLAAGLEHHRGWAALHAHRANVSGVPGWISAEARSRHLINVFTQRSLHRDLDSARSILAAAGVDWLVVKGPALADRFYDTPAERHYQDLDVLVESVDLRPAIAALSSAGWVLLDRNWRLALERMAGEVHLVGPNGTVIDLHWSLQNRDYRRSRLGLGPRSLIASAVQADLGGVTACTLSTEDTVIHLALHAIGDGGDRLLWLKDVAQVLAGSETAWPELAARAHAWGAGVATAMVLQRTSRALQSPIPPAIIRDLDRHVPSRFTEWAVSTGSPMHRVTGPNSSVARWTRLRSEPPSKLRPGLSPRRRLARTPFVESADNPDSLLHDDGGAAGFEAFLQAVEAHPR